MKQTNRKLIADLLESNPEYRKPAMRFHAIGRLVDEDPEKCKLIYSMVEEIRHQTVSDDVGLAKAEEWKASPALKKQTSDWDNTFKQHAL